MNFTSDTKVELTVKFSDATAEADYLIEDDKVKISSAGQTQVFTIDKNGCLDGGQMIGKFCKM
ncbi:hypothetical protein [Methylobacter svalbardensis]|uniref:hypothetical protein n=1 Tax=Methylobacter svalbardensis TaxID=3080016 RepID=UPI0030ED8BBB